MSSWTHSICDNCYGERCQGQVPMSVVNAKHETCCFCGAVTCDGIYLRADPETTPYCKHED